MYYHYVLEAKLVTDNGLSLSVATEFIENKDPNATKQDCELKAFRRLSEKLKSYFPQLKICLLLDGLYAAEPVFKICQKNNWQFIITFKEGSMPANYREFEALKDLQRENRLETIRDGEKQKHAWVNDLEYEKIGLSVLQTDLPFDAKHFVWLTSFRINKSNVSALSNEGGRNRWRIENEGFNIQKNGGYGLEHPYCEQENGMKNFYFLLQIAHIINQLMVKGSLLRDFKKLAGTLLNFAKLLREHLRTKLIPFSLNDMDFTRTIQIRFDTG